MKYFLKLFKQIGAFFSALSPQRKVAALGISGAIFVSILSLFIWAGKQGYAPLMTNLNPEDSAQVIKLLREKNIPFQVASGGRSIQVAPEFIDQLRMDLAISGMPESSVVGYELFDKNTLGQTAFMQKMNQKRALEGEIMRSIKSMNGVRRARVHLAIPQKSAFVEDQRKPTASVVLDLEPGITLSERQVVGIGNLVSKAVEGLDVEDVVIVDSMGKTISKNRSDSLGAMTSTQIEFKSLFEREIEKRIEEMLSRVVGDGKVVAKVNADLDYSSSKEKKTLYDADGSAVVSTQTNTQSMEGSKPQPAGLPGAQSNLPTAQLTPPAAIKITDTKTNNTVTNYNVPTTVVETSKNPGALKRLSVAVVLDGKTVKTTNKDGVVESKVEAWSEEKIKEFEAVVASAAGIDRKRGDTLEIKNMEFTANDFSEAEAYLESKEKKAYIKSLTVYGIVGTIVMLFFFLVVRPFIKWITDNTTDGVESFLPQTLEELEKLSRGTGLPGLEDAVPVIQDGADPDKIESSMIREKIRGFVDSDPQKAALILKDWVVGVNDGKDSQAGAAKDQKAKAEAG